MKATTAAAAAVLLGSVSADWESWSGSSSADPTTAPAAQTWSEVDTTTYTTPDATTDASTWSAWESSADPTTTSSADPSWGAWDSSSTPVDKTTTTTDSSSWSEWTSSSTSADPTTWSEWESSTTTSADPTHTWGAWSSSSSSDDDTTSYTWSNWASTPVASTTTDPAQSWGAWEPTSTVTSTSTQWITVTVYPADGGQTWGAWDGDAGKTAINTDVAVVSSTVTETASSASASASWGAWDAATPAADAQCKLEISVSYGQPIWYPTPVIATSSSSSSWGEWDGSSTAVASTTDAAETWSEWAASSSTPAVATSTATWGEWDGSSSASASSSDAAETWGTWTASSSDSAASTDGAWGEWSSASTTPAAVTSTASWAAWGSSQTQGGAFYTASAGGSWSEVNSGSWSTGKSGISSNGNKFGMTYSPYTSGGGCKDQGTVNNDIAAIAAKGFTSVRVYSTDCSTLEFVGGAAKQNGIKIILGVFISDTGIAGAQPQVDAIAAWAQWEVVELIVVGNEAVFNNRCSASDLAGFIGSAKKSFQAAGFNGAISTTDELSIWQSQGSAWCDVVDVVSANLYAFFNPNTAAEDAGSFIQAQISDLSQVCPGKEVYVMESGWPSAGECNGKACPSPENQATAVKGIQQTSGAKVVFFSFEDEQWKQPGQFGVEQHWGCGSVFN